MQLVFPRNGGLTDGKPVTELSALLQQMTPGHLLRYLQELSLFCIAKLVSCKLCASESFYEGFHVTKELNVSWLNLASNVQHCDGCVVLEHFMPMYNWYSTVAHHYVKYLFRALYFRTGWKKKENEMKNENNAQWGYVWELTVGRMWKHRFKKISKSEILSNLNQTVKTCCVGTKPLYSLSWDKPTFYSVTIQACRSAHQCLWSGCCRASLKALSKKSRTPHSVTNWRQLS